VIVFILITAITQNNHETLPNNLLYIGESIDDGIPNQLGTLKL